jgi:putative transposase
MTRPRLSRLDELYPGYSIYFITCCAHERQSLLANALIHEAFQSYSKEAQRRHVLIGRYVIMPDHLHFFVDLPEEIGISIWIKSLKNSLSKTLRNSGHPSPHWQKGFFDHVIRSEDSYEAKWLYVRENPVRQGLVEKPELWAYQGELNIVPFSWAADEISETAATQNEAGGLGRPPAINLPRCSRTSVAGPRDNDRPSCGRWRRCASRSSCAS